MKLNPRTEVVLTCIPGVNFFVAINTCIEYGKEKNKMEKNISELWAGLDTASTTYSDVKKAVEDEAKFRLEGKWRLIEGISEIFGIGGLAIVRAIQHLTLQNPTKPKDKGFIRFCRTH